MEYTVKEYAAKRKVKPQAIQRAISKELSSSLPCPRLPGVAAIRKEGRSYRLAIIPGTKIPKGRPSTYVK